MTKGKKIAIAAGIVGLLGVAGLAGAAYADRSGYGWHHGGGWHQGWEGRGKYGHRRHMRRMGMRMMERFDTDNDGRITRTEVDTVRKDLVTKHDADKDGKITLQEFEGIWLEMMRPRMVRRFQFFDRDGDASISAEEIDRPINRMFSRMDRNDDGAISKEDRPRRWRKWREERRERDERRGDDN